jgi:hypothetical protein
MKVLNPLKAWPWCAAILAVALTGAVAGSASAAVSRLTFDPTAQLSPGRLHATLTGTLTCDAGTTTFLAGRILQPRTVNGSGSDTITCSGTAQRYRFDVPAFDSVYSPGLAVVDVTATQCDDVQCTSTFADGQITLNR